MAHAQVTFTECVVFELAGWRYGIDASSVVELLRAVTIVPLPKAPAIVEGVINLRGKVLPVLDIRARFNLPARSAALSDRLIIVSIGDRLVALRVDSVLHLARISEAEIDDVRRAVPGAAYVAGVAKLPDGLTLIHDPETFLSRAESEALAAFDRDGVAT